MARGTWCCSTRSRAARAARDYLQKDATYLKLLLPIRVRHAVEAARERRLRHAAPADLERLLRQTWTEALTPGLDPHRKGRLLEETLLLLFRTMPGLDEVSVNRRGAHEEFDVVVMNQSVDPVLAKEGSYILVECKNWSRPADPPVLSYFRTKLKDRFGRVQLGLLVSGGGFTAGVKEQIPRWNNEPQLVVLVDGNALTAWIDAVDRVAWLKQLIASAALR